MASVMRFDQWQDSDGNPVLDGTGLAIPSSALPAGSILQVVRATDTTQRTTTSTSFVDVTGLSVTITPTKSTSSILILVSVNIAAVSSTNFAAYRITDASNNPISGAEESFLGPAFKQNPGFFSAFASPATTSPVTYKFRFRVDNSATTAQVRNEQSTGQIFAIEVAA